MFMNLFLTNKYTKWYFAIVNNAKLRLSEGYQEKHHIIPKSLGGDNSKENLVNLTAREHFICHWLLTKMVTGINRHKMLTAVHRMMTQKNSHQQRITSFGKKYENIRIAWARSHSQWLTGRYSGVNNPNYGNTMSIESKKKISDLKLGKKAGPMSAEHKEKISKALTGVPKTYGDKIRQSWVLTKESRIGENHPMYGKTHSDVSKQKMKDAAAKRWTPEARAKFSARKKELFRLKNIKGKNDA